MIKFLIKGFKIKQYDVGSKGMSYEEKKKYLFSLGEDRFIRK